MYGKQMYSVSIQQLRPSTSQGPWEVGSYPVASHWLLTPSS